MLLLCRPNTPEFKSKYSNPQQPVTGKKKINNCYFKGKYNNQIPYKDLTYGELISYINKEGLAICSNLRLNAKLKKDKITGKNELGDFCEQYGYEPLKTPSSSKRKKYYSKRKYSSKRYPLKYDKRENYKAYKKRKSYKKPYKKYNKTSNNRKDKQQVSKDIIICYK